MPTGRLYGATAYDILLRTIAPQSGVARRPSSATIQQAVVRAHALTTDARIPANARDRPAGVEATPALDVDAMRQTLAPVVCDALAPLHALLSSTSAGSGTHRAAVGGEPAARDTGTELALTRAVLEDAHSRIRRLEAELGEVRRELGAVQAARGLAGEHVNAMLAELRDTIVAFGHDGASRARPSSWPEPNGS